jgi:DNA-directed RNA polymerase subunit beta
MTPEEKLLRAIFGEKASDVRDTSLRMPPGAPAPSSKFASSTATASRRTSVRWQIEREEIERLAKDRDDEQAILDRNVYGRLSDMLVGKTAIAGPKGFKKGAEVNAERLPNYPRSQWWSSPSRTRSCRSELEALRSSTTIPRSELESRFMDKVEKVQRGDELPPGVMKMVKVFVAVKRKIQPGDKMAGRHGNKGVVSRILPSKTCRSWKTDAGRHRAQPARRAVAHERRSDPRDPSGLGLRAAWASRSAPMSRCLQ